MVRKLGPRVDNIDKMQLGPSCAKRRASSTHPPPRIKRRAVLGRAGGIGASSANRTAPLLVFHDGRRAAVRFVDDLPGADGFIRSPPAAYRVTDTRHQRVEEVAQAAVGNHVEACRRQRLRGARLDPRANLWDPDGIRFEAGPANLSDVAG